MLATPLNSPAWAQVNQFFRTEVSNLAHMRLNRAARLTVNCVVTRRTGEFLNGGYHVYGVDPDYRRSRAAVRRRRVLGSWSRLLVRNVLLASSPARTTIFLRAYGHGLCCGLPFAARAVVHIGAQDDRAAATTGIGKKLNGQGLTAIERAALPNGCSNLISPRWARVKPHQNTGRIHGGIRRQTRTSVLRNRLGP
jgi:hypothetical protein